MKKDRNDYRAMRDDALLRAVREELNPDWHELAIVLAERLREKGEYR